MIEIWRDLAFLGKHPARLLASLVLLINGWLF